MSVLPQVELGSLSLPSYLVVLVLALAAGTAVAVERGRLDCISRRVVLPMAVVTSLAGVAGARLWSVAVEMAPLTDDMPAAALWRSSGFSVFGGLALGGAVALGIGRAMRTSPMRVADALAPGVALGIATGRIGCLLSGCCFGRPTVFPIALVFDDFHAAARPIGVPLHATQVYESLGALLLCIGLWCMPARWGAGTRTGALLVGYGIVRALVEPLRGDYRGWIASWPATSVSALGLVVLGVVAVVVARLATTRPRSAPSPAHRDA